MSAQTTYSLNHNEGYAGGIYALHDQDIDSRAVETAAGADFGIAVSRGTDLEKQCVIGGTAFIGITVRSVDREGLGDGTVKYAQTETAGIMRKGYIYVTLAAGGNPGAALKYDNTTGVIDVGAAGAGETQLDGAELETVTAAGALGVVRLTSTATTAGS